MKKISQIVLILAITALCANAQNLKITEGTSFVPEKGKLDYYIDQDNNALYVARYTVRATTNGLFIQKIDLKSLLPVYCIPLEQYDCTIKLINDKILVFTSKYEKKEKTYYYLLREYSASTGKELGPQKQIIATLVDPKQAETTAFYVRVSDDKSKMAIIHEYQKENGNPEVALKLYETGDYKKLADKKLISAYNNSTIDCVRYILDNSGAFYYLFNYMADFDAKIAGIAVGILPFEDAKSIVTPCPFTSNLDVANGTFKVLNKDLVFCGLYKDRISREEKKQGKKSQAGVYSFFVDIKTGNVKTKGFDYFTQEVNEKLTYKDGLIEERPADKFYSFEEIITTDFGTFLIESHSYQISSNHGISSYERELLVSKFDNSGKMEWMKIIPKFTANGLNEFNYLVKERKIYFFYAEHPKNLEKTTITDYNPKKYQPIKNYNGSFLVCTSIDEKGSLERKEVFRNKGWCYDPSGTNIVLDNGKTLLLRMINDERERYDKISLGN